MTRSYTKCQTCNDLLWFGVNDSIPQHVVCSCKDTELTENGAVGNYTTPGQEEIDSMV